MAYSTAQALVDLKRSLFWNEYAVIREPLEGLVDSLNKVFYTPQRPLSSVAGVTVYDSAGDEVSSGSYSVESYEAGTITFNSAPAVRHYVSCTVQTLPDTMLDGVVLDGFDEMEARYNRNWYLTTSGGLTYVSSSPSSVVDPVCGGLVFSTSRLQIKLYLLCCEYALLKAQFKYAAANYFRYREGRVAGVMVDRSRNADQLRLALDVLDRDIEDAVMGAASQAGDPVFGGYVAGTKSDIYLAQYDWWTGSKQSRGEIG